MLIIKLKKKDMAAGIFIICYQNNYRNNKHLALNEKNNWFFTAQVFKATRIKFNNIYFALKFYFGHNNTYWKL